MRYYVENTLENLTLIRTISDSFLHKNTRNLFNDFNHCNTILLVTGEDSTPVFRFRDMPQTLLLSEAELRKVVFALSLEQ